MDPGSPIPVFAVLRDGSKIHAGASLDHVIDPYLFVS